MRTPDHVGTLFEGLTKQLGGGFIQAPLLDMTFHKDPSLMRTIGTHAYYQGNVLRVMAIAQLMTTAAAYVLRRRDYPVDAANQDGFIALHRALSQAQDKLSTSLSMSGISLLDLKEDETLHPSSVAAASLHSAFQQSVKGRSYLNKLLDLLTLWAASVQSAIDDALTSDVDKALRLYFDEVVTATSVLRALTKSVPEVVVAKPTIDNTIEVTQTPIDTTEGTVAESLEATDLSANVTFEEPVALGGVLHPNISGESITIPEASSLDFEMSFSAAYSAKESNLEKPASQDLTLKFESSKEGSVLDSLMNWATLIKDQDGVSIADLIKVTESANGAIGMDTPQGDVDAAVNWLLTNESGMIWGSALLTYFGLLDYASDQLINSDDHNFKENVSSKLLRGLAGKMAKASRDIEGILLSSTKDPLGDMGLWDAPPAGVVSRSVPSKTRDILADIDFDDALDNLMAALAKEGGKGFIDCFSKVVLALANAVDDIKARKLLAALEEPQRDQMQELLMNLSLALGRALDDLAVQFRSARLYDKGLAKN
ncbi:MAG: hypothetical protein GY833_12205 [Aestuariibacter sp.]|nr:hypothetical protein [Aestuariibacter sp.]|tara:strand:+ start:27578 stop:29200 length:1623 start_codon:yes stop_codon:yes gene_type:complete